MGKYAPEIHDVRTWTATCPYCGRRVKYHGQYEGEQRECDTCWCATHTVTGGHVTEKQE